MGRVPAVETSKGFTSSHQRTRQIDYADIIDTQLRRILNASNEGRKQVLIQTVDDLSDFLTPHKDWDFKRDLIKLNEWKSKQMLLIQKEDSNKKRKIAKMASLQYESKRKLWKSLMNLLSRSGFFPARFIELDIDVDPVKHYKEMEEEFEGKKSYEEMGWKDLLQLGKAKGVKGKGLSRKKIIEQLKQIEAEEDESKESFIQESSKEEGAENEKKE